MRCFSKSSLDGRELGAASTDFVVFEYLCVENPKLGYYRRDGNVSKCPLHCLTSVDAIMQLASFSDHLFCTATLKAFLNEMAPITSFF
jgi:hypothetical protein